MAPRPAAGGSLRRKRIDTDGKPGNNLSGDILRIIFSFIDLCDLIRCSLVCKHWNIITRDSLLLDIRTIRYQEKHVVSPRKPWRDFIEDVAMEEHRASLKEYPIRVSKWVGHSVRVEQCRMKMGLILTGIGDRVMRLWSAGSCSCVEEYSIPEKMPLIDFDFDEGKIVGLVGRQLCIWNRNGRRSIFPSREGTFVKGLCMRYSDPEAVVGCEDGTARVFDMYSRTCSRIIRMLAGPMTCLCVSDDQLIIGGSFHGNVVVSGLQSDQQVGTLRSRNIIGIKTLCYNPSSHLVFGGSTAGHVYCWDLRTMGCLWESRVSPNVIYSLQHLQNDRSSLAVGGIDGILRVLDQNTGALQASCIMDSSLISTRENNFGVVEERAGKRLSNDAPLDRISRRVRPPITSLAVGMGKIVTTHNDKFIRLWKFRN